jgi:3-ketosteroid 9alpha-monooxygenase subunit B
VTAFQRFRGWHWLLACSLLAVYLTGDDAERAHIWLGYGLIVLLTLRLLLAPLRLRGVPALLPPGKPTLQTLGRWLTFGALLSFAIASLTGLGMVDNGKVLAALPGVPANPFGRVNLLAWLDDAEDAHEFFANLGLTLVALHIGHVLVFRNKFALAILRGQPGAGGGGQSRLVSWATLLAHCGWALLSRLAPVARAFARRSMSRRG